MASEMYLDGRKLKILTIDNKEIYRNSTAEVVVEVYNKYTNSVEEGVKVIITNGEKTLVGFTNSFGICKFMPGYGQWTISCDCPEEYEVESKTINLQQSINLELLQVRE